MLSFFKRKSKNPQKQGLDSTIESKDVTAKDENASSEELVRPKLSFHPDWDIKEEDRYVYQFLNNDCEPLKPNQLSLSGLELQRNEMTGVVTVNALVRTSLNRPIKLEEMALVLLGPEKELLAKKHFDLSELGELPAASSRPWNFVFEPSTVKVDELPESGWTLAFQLKPAHQLDLEESWEQALPEEEKEKLKDLVEKQLTPPGEGEVNFMGLQIRHDDNQNLHVSVLIRNGSEKDVTFQQIPLIVEDASGEVIATGGFRLDEFRVKAYTTKPWTFIFPKELVQKETMDLSTWKVYPKQ
ncbi:accessory Sec system S-layer assembly protein [Priestia abyssalis]|uniref:accessory Sec system S-layer assembly protein n=1 Tax=Priestia abyssalis TaxID=1221450 RepID=UPI000994FA3D|nr:accessory Sec system S-layer assembly protein [Priestia abyssalis]